MGELTEELLTKRDRLLQLIHEFGSCAVALSGGVDSAVVAKAAQMALGGAAVAVTGKSAALADGEIDEALRLADVIGIRHFVLPTEEFTNPAYVANRPDRCYHCKTELYDQVQVLAEELGVSRVLNGANADDQHDFRPGTAAASEHRVRSPLAECGLTKSEVRQLATAWELPVADKPATPCLASRVAYGLEVIPERLKRIDRAEQFLRSLGFRELRVRYHSDDIARIEVPVSELSRFYTADIRSGIVDEFKQLGFKFVTVDLEGLRSGGFAALVSPEMLARFS
jgi:uncharacterized protein